MRTGGPGRLNLTKLGVQVGPDDDAELRTTVTKALRPAMTMNEVLDIEAWVAHEHERATGAAADEIAESTGGARRPLRRGLLYTARKHRVGVLTERLGKT